MHVYMIACDSSIECQHPHAPGRCVILKTEIKATFLHHLMGGEEKGKKDLKII